MSTKEGEEWAQLVCTTDINTPTVSICAQKFSVGRALGCSLSLPENKLISGQHCVLLRSEDGAVTLQDTSTNGTLVSSSGKKTRVTKGNSHKLQHGDEIFLVFKKDDPTKNVAYMFQDLSQLLDETLVNEDPGIESDEECTEEYEVKTTEADIRPGDTPTKRPVSGEDSTKVETVPTKKPRDDDIDKEGKVCGIDKDKEPDGIGTAIDTSAAAASDKCKTVGDSAAAVETPAGGAPSGGNAQEAAGEGIAESLICSICQDIFHDCISLQPCLHSFCAACYSSWMEIAKDCPSCRNQVERISRNFIVNGLVEAFVKEHPDRKRADDEKAEMDAKNKITGNTMDRPVRDSDEEYYSEEDEENEDDDSENGYNDLRRHHGDNFRPYFFPRPISICMQCPGYLGPGFDAGIVLNPPNLPPASASNGSAAPKPPCLLLPAAAASTSTATDQAASSTGTSSSGTATGQAATGADTSAATTAQASTSTEASSSTAGTTSTAADTSAAAATAQASSSAGASAGTATPPRIVVCRGYKRTLAGEYIPMPVVPQYVCQQAANHLMCGCCRCQMPDRRQENFNNPNGVPSQKCDVCGNFFCHRYWGCKKVDCNGCLNQFRDLHFGQRCLDTVILKNNYESEIFKDYLRRKGLGWKDVLDSCMIKLDSGEYICQDGAISRISSGNTLCYHCGLRNFQELAYQYRRDIPKSDFSRQIAARPDCHWGNKCRTQISKPHHAKNFNHICEQTKF